MSHFTKWGNRNAQSLGQTDDFGHLGLISDSHINF